MEIQFLKNKIVFNRKLSILDEFVLDFCKLMDKAKIKYVIISGYVFILFGRPRGTEDVDIFIEDGFERLVPMLKKNGFWTINCSEGDAASLIKEHPIRIAKKGKVFPNIEIKPASEELDFYSLNNRKKLLLNKNTLYLSPLELQIAYKLYLGSEKDLEDARFLFKELKEHLNKGEIIKFAIKLKVAKKLKYLGEKFEV